MGWFQQLFSTKEFMPHGMCYEWDPYVIWLHVVSDAAIAISYYSIPLTLIYFVHKRKDLAFDWIFTCFAIFIVACGTTHVMEILNIWHPSYWLSGLIKALTAIASVVTAILLIRLVPQALALPSPEQLRRTNAALENEIRERTEAAKKVDMLNQKLLENADNLVAVNKELETFAYSVSHDLRAPLRHIDGYITLLDEENPALSVESKRYMTKVTDSARQMSLLIDNLLAFSGLGRATMTTEWVDTNQLVTESCEELEPAQYGRPINWKIDPLPRVFVDRNLFKQVWMNLLGNALKYSSKKDQIEIAVECRKVDSNLEFSVRDNGAGFDMRYVDKLFGIFQRLHPREQYEGTGIGLANVKRIVTRHGGKIWAEGRPGQGATFSFTLPQSKTAPRPLD